MSTIKVDTYLTRGGASEIAIDKLKGASSASSISVVGEGGTTTTNLQQGLAKAWISFNGGVTTPVAIDSFGTSTLTDNGTGDYSQTLTNAMGNANYTHSGSAGVNDGSGNAASQRVYGYNTARTQSTTVYNINTGYDNSNAINAYVTSNVHGDLA